jgi:DNA-binding SARP family transcriptional activator
LPGTLRGEYGAPMGMPEQLEVVAHGATAMLATWIGLTVGLRAPRSAGARAFGVLAALLVLWSLSIIVRRLTEEAAVDEVGRWFEVVGASLLPAAVLTVATALTVERQTPRWLAIALVGFWAISIGVVVLTVVAPELEPRIAPPHLSFPGVPGEVVGWAWIAIRVAIFAAAIAWVALALRDVGPDRARQRQLQVTLLALVVGTIGGVLRIAPPFSDNDPWIGVSMVTLSVVLASYAVFAQGIFFAPEIAGRAFRLSALAGVGITLYVGVLLGVDSVVRTALAIDLPVVIGLALVATIAVFEPVAARVRRWLSSGEGDPTYDRLLRALGEEVLTTRRPEDSIEPAMGQLARTLGLSGAEARDASGEVIASSGPVGPAPLELPLERDGTAYGAVAFGAKESGLPFTSAEREVLEMATGYLAASLELGARQAEQARDLERLSRERAAVSTRGRRLHGALEASLDSAARAGLQVFALGPLRGERDGELIRQWGGEKAGTRQAEALFAFLFDRGERGVTKDEAVELIWPDVDLDRADLAFHRTLGGLRRTLEPGRGQRQGSKAIGFSNDRYRLDPSVVAWTDVGTFEQRLTDASAATDPASALAALMEARSLYRGEYLDDCPFYGDSAFVEDRRELLRARYVDLLLSLGGLHEQRGDRGAAAAAFREARLAAQDDCPPADAALERLGFA